jgi:hypothetical protein
MIKNIGYYSGSITGSCSSCSRETPRLTGRAAALFTFLRGVHPAAPPRSTPAHPSTGQERSAAPSSGRARSRSRLPGPTGSSRLQGANRPWLAPRPGRSATRPAPATKPKPAPGADAPLAAACPSHSPAQAIPEKEDRLTGPGRSFVSTQVQILTLCRRSYFDICISPPGGVRQMYFKPSPLVPNYGRSSK